MVRHTSWTHWELKLHEWTVMSMCVMKVSKVYECGSCQIKWSWIELPRPWQHVERSMRADFFHIHITSTCVKDIFGICDGSLKMRED